MSPGVIKRSRKARFLSVLVFLSICSGSGSEADLVQEDKATGSLPLKLDAASQKDDNESASACQTTETNGCIVAEKVTEMRATCPELQAKIWKNHFPRGQKAAGNYTEVPKNVTTPEECANRCCADPTCHYSFTINATCYLLNCIHGEYLCAPVFSSLNGETNLSMILVRVPRTTNLAGITCEVGADTTCKANQKCIPTNHRSRNGVCVCEADYFFDGDTKECVHSSEAVKPEAPIVPTLSSSTTESPVQLIVSVSSKNVTLPNNEVSLPVYVVPQAPADKPYTYKWTLISNPPDDTATVEGHTTDTLRLTGLKEGKYVFQVTASSLASIGSANATINVFAEQKPNQAPIAVISPVEQNIQLPTSSAVLDASLSTDDEKIIAYKWELQKGPILYAFNPSKSLNSSTLQVENLIPGNYTFKLTVEDSQHATNSTTAFVTVIKQPDYPPTANPGQDIVIYLPQTEVTLNGNASTDDKKIVEWEWKATGEQTKAIDMQDTHTPFLKLSHLQVGLYQFELKVTDEAGQFSTATVHVVVKESTGSPPKADAGSDQTTVLNKQNWMILDGSNSKSESNKIAKFMWSQIRGPNVATILPMENGMKANVSGLTKGEYEFLLTVEDESKLKANDSVTVTVIQRNNQPPKANAGGNREVRLPVSFVRLNGSASTDDVKIVEWAWKRQPDSLAAGTVLQGSESTPFLLLTNLVPGKYIFTLTVKDEQGSSDEDSAVITVVDEPRQQDVIEVVLQVPLSQLTESDKNKVIQQLSLLFHDMTLTVDHIEQQMHSGFAVLQLHGEDSAGAVINGSVLNSELRQRFYQDAGLFQFPLYSIDTKLCLDKCSGHGECQDSPEGRECVCNAFWMENFLKRRFGSKDRNCEWSKIYVGVVVSLLIVMLFALLWSMSFIFRRNFRVLKDNLESPASRSSPTRSSGKRYPSQKRHYTLLDDEEMELRAREEEEDEEESEDSDSDILFEQSKRGKSRNGSLLMTPLTGNGVRNGILKNSRRIKT